MTAASPGDRSSALDWLQLGAIATHFPVLWLARNTRNQPDILAMGSATAVVLACAVLIVLILWRAGLPRQKAVGLGSMALIIFWYWPSLAQPIASLEAAPAAAIASLLLLMVGYVFGDTRPARLVLTAGGWTMLIVGLVFVGMRTADDGEFHLKDLGQAAIHPNSADLPDFYIVVFDGMARSDVLADMYGFDDRPFRRRLADEGFTVADAASSNYSITHFSLASMFEMGYPLARETIPSRRDLDALVGSMSGESAYVEAMKQVGYSYVHGGHGWWGTPCGEPVDLCLDTPGLDLTVFELFRPTPIGDLLQRGTGSPATEATLARLDQLGDWDSIIASAAGPRLVFLHLGLPHPPLFLDASCNVIIESDRRGTVLNGTPALPEDLMVRRRAGYVGQVECAHLFAERLIEAVPDDAVILLLSDHGPDSLGQLGLPPDEVDARGRWERMSILTASRIPGQCDDAIPDDVSLVNVLALATNCALGSDLSTRPDLFFVTPATGTVLPLHQVEDPDLG